MCLSEEPTNSKRPEPAVRKFTLTRVSKFTLTRVSDEQIEVWTRPLAGGAIALAIFNIGPDRDVRPYHVDLSRLGLHGPQQARDLWTHKPVTLSDSLPLELQGHDVMMLRIEHPH